MVITTTRGRRSGRARGLLAVAIALMLGGVALAPPAAGDTAPGTDEDVCVLLGGVYVEGWCLFEEAPDEEALPETWQDQCWQFNNVTACKVSTSKKIGHGPRK